MEFPQTTFAEVPAIGYEGGLVEGGGEIFRTRTGKATSSIRFGTPVVRSTAPDGVRALLAADILVTDDNSIVLVQTATTGAQVFDRTQAGGVLGAGPFPLAHKIIITFNSHANWDATTGVLRYIDVNGAVQEEDVPIADTTPVLYESLTFAREFLAFNLPAQGGTSATFVIGTNADQGDLRILGIAQRNLAIIQAATPLGYEDGDVVTYVEDGSIGVLVEDAVVEGAQAYVRLVATGGEYIGQWRSDPDGTDAMAVYGCTFRKAGAAGAIVPLKIRDL